MNNYDSKTMPITDLFLFIHNLLTCSIAKERLEVGLGDAADGVDVGRGAVVLGHVAPQGLECRGLMY